MSEPITEQQKAQWARDWREVDAETPLAPAGILAELFARRVHARALAEVRERERAARIQGWVDGATEIVDSLSHQPQIIRPTPTRPTTGEVAQFTHCFHGLPFAEYAARRYPAPEPEKRWREIVAPDGVTRWQVRDGVVWYKLGPREWQRHFCADGNVAAVIADLASTKHYADAALLCDLAANPTEEDGQ